MTVHDPLRVLVLGPALDAISGVSTHLQTLLGPDLGLHFSMQHFQVGSEGRQEQAPRRFLRLLLSPFQLAWVILRDGVDILHLNTSMNRRAFWRDLSYLLLARLLGVKVLYQLHGGQLPLDFVGGHRLPAALLRACLRQTGIIVVLAQCELAAYRQFLPGHPISLLPNAIDPRPLAGLVRPPRLPAQGLRLLYIGRLAPDKGLRESLAALADVRQSGRPVHLTLVGGGPETASLRHQVSRLGLGAAVSFAGPCFGEAKTAALAGADVLLLPSYAEGLPYALLEGMAAGLAVIATPVGAIPDVVIGPQHGLLVPPRRIPELAAAMRSLADDPARVASMGKANRARIATDYSLPHLIKGTARLYFELGAAEKPLHHSSAGR